jgi:hypothetical protein
MFSRRSAPAGFGDPDSLPTGGARPRRLFGQGWNRGAPDNDGAVAALDGRGVAAMRVRVRQTLNAAEHDEQFSRAVAALIEAAHAFNRWEPNAETFDTLCDAAEQYSEDRKRFAVRLREEE